MRSGTELSQFLRVYLPTLQGQRILSFGKKTGHYGLAVKSADS